MAHAIVIWLALAGVLAALTHGGPAAVVGDGAVAVAAAVFAVAARGSVIIAGLRRGRVGVAVDGSGRAVVALTSAAIAGVAAAITAALASVVPLSGAALLCAACLIGVLCAALVPTPRAIRPWATTAARFIAAGAVLAAIIASAVGALVAATRFGFDGEVAPGALAKVLAATLLCDGLLGVGGFARAAVLVGRAAVDVPASAIGERVPGPIVVALLMAAVTALVGPSVLPPIAADLALSAKVVVGAVVGGALHVLGGLRGLAAAHARRAP